VILLLDTSLLIDVLRGRNSRGELLREWAQVGHTLATTAVNVAELYAGMRTHEEVATEAFLSGLECYELTPRAGRLAGRFVNDWRRKGRTLQLPDAIVAAVAIERNCLLATDNRKDFPMPELKLYAF